MKTKTFIYSKFLFIALIFVLSVFCTFGNVEFSNAQTQYDFSSNITSSSFSVEVEAISTQGKVIAGNPLIFNSVQSYQFDWQTIKYFNISYKAGAIPPVADDEGNFTYTVSVQYLNAYISDNKDFDNASVQEKTLISNQVTKDLSTIKDIQFSLQLTDFENLTGENIDNDKWLGWGIYRFIIDIEGAGESYSTYYGAEPARLDAKPQIEYTIIPSKNDLTNAYRFTLKGNESINYIDQSTIKWYVKGEANDGTLYVLSQEDIGLFDNYNTAMHSEAIERYGKVFEFDSVYSGRWEVFCELIPHGNTIASHQSDIIEVTTGRKINANSIIWFLVAGGAVLLGIIIAIILYTKKKEKVW